MGNLYQLFLTKGFRRFFIHVSLSMGSIFNDQEAVLLWCRQLCWHYFLCLQCFFGSFCHDLVHVSTDRKQEFSVVTFFFSRQSYGIIHRVFSFHIDLCIRWHIIGLVVAATHDFHVPS